MRLSLRYLGWCQLRPFRRDRLAVAMGAGHPVFRGSLCVTIRRSEMGGGFILRVGVFFCCTSLRAG